MNMCVLWKEFHFEKLYYINIYKKKTLVSVI